MNQYIEMISELQNKHSSMFYRYAEVLKKSYEEYRENIMFLIQNRKLYQEHKNIIPGFSRYNSRQPNIKAGRTKFISLYGGNNENIISLARLKFQNLEAHKIFLHKCKAILWLETCSINDIHIIGEYAVNKDNERSDHLEHLIYLESKDIINVLSYRMT